MAYDPTLKRYAKDLGVPVPNVEFCPTEFPRLHTFPAPYLPLVLENERHDEHYVVLTGKVVALDSLGFLVPAGLALQLEATTALDNGAAVAQNISDAFTKYTAVDVAAGVRNSRGALAILGEPVVRSMLNDDEATSVNVANGQAFPAADGGAVTVGDHIGVASYSWLRASSDLLTRYHNDNGDALIPANPADLRNLAWEPQLSSKTVRTNYCLEYPVVVDRSGIKLGGQAVAIGADASAFAHGVRVTYNVDSDIVPYSNPSVVADDVVGFAANADDILEAVNVAVVKLAAARARIVGQVVKRNERSPTSYLDKVRTRWESSVKGFEHLDRMPGSATLGKPWHLHTAGAVDSVVISLFMR